MSRAGWGGRVRDFIGLRRMVCNLKLKNWDFPGGAVVKNPPANAGNTGLNPGLGRSHMPWSD